jgi:hypothetical protein
MLSYEKDLLMPPPTKHHAAFWDNPDQGDDTPVVRHAPDADHYHYADQGMSGKMPAGRVGRFATIPAARKDGTSRGFDSDTAGVVHIDPDAPDGGVVVDLSQLNRNDMNQAVATSRYPHQVFYTLARLPEYQEHGQEPIQEQPQPRLNPSLPSTYVVPASGTNGEQIETAQEEFSMRPVLPVGPLQARPPEVQQQPVMQPAPQPYAMYPPQPQAYYPPPVQQDPQMLNMLQQLAANMQTLQQRFEQREAQPQPVSGNRRGLGLRNLPAPQTLTTAPVDPDDEEEYRPRVAASYKKRVESDEEQEEEQPVRRRNSLLVSDRRQRSQTVQDYAESQDEPGQGVVIGFETLNLPFVNGPLPQKPKIQTLFEYEGRGKYSAQYHYVKAFERVLVLGYDTRYEEGTQYLPPDLDSTEIRVSVPSLKKTFVVSSMGQDFEFGVFALTVLVRIREDDI